MVVISLTTRAILLALSGVTSRSYFKHVRLTSMRQSGLAYLLDCTLQISQRVLEVCTDVVVVVMGRHDWQTLSPILV